MEHDYLIDMTIFQIRHLLNMAEGEEDAIRLLAESNINLSGEQIRDLVDEYYG